MGDRTETAEGGLQVHLGLFAKDISKYLGREGYEVILTIIRDRRVLNNVGSSMDVENGQKKKVKLTGLPRNVPFERAADYSMTISQEGYKDLQGGKRILELVRCSGEDILVHLYPIPSPGGLDL